MTTSIKMFTIGVSVNHLARGKANRDVKEKRINSYSQFINEAFDKNSNQNKFRAKRFLTED